MIKHDITPDLILIRDQFTLKMCTGILTYKGAPLILDGLTIYLGEDVARPDGVKIQNETAIWAGDYWIRMTMSARFKMILPLIYNEQSDFSVTSGTKKFTGVRQHAGNTEADTDACQLLGSGRNAGGVWSSGKALEKYLPWINDLVSRNGGVIPYRIINQQAA